VFTFTFRLTSLTGEMKVNGDEMTGRMSSPDAVTLAYLKSCEGSGFGAIAGCYYLVVWVGGG
jgi:hypothetical protein